MAEISRFWQGTAVGDAIGQAPYDAPTEFSGAMATYSGSGGTTFNGGVLRNVNGNQLIATGAATPVTLGAGEAVVHGSYYSNSANISFAIPAPISATRIDRIVLRKNWAAQTVRSILLTGIEGSGIPPAPTQIAGSLWEYPLWQVSIAFPSNVITLIDDRNLIDGLMSTPYTSGFAAAAVVTGTAIQHIKGPFSITMPPGGGKIMVIAQHAFDYTGITFHTDTDAFNVLVYLDGAQVVHIENQIIQEFTTVRSTVPIVCVLEGVTAGVHSVDFFGFWTNDNTAVATSVNDARWTRYHVFAIA